MALQETPVALIVSDLVKTFKAMAIYPSGHPARARFYKRLVEEFPRRLGAAPELNLSIRRGGLDSDGQPVRTRDGAEAFLGTECFLRQIARLRLLRGMTQEDFDTLFSVLGQEPQDLRERGGVVEFVRGRGSGALLFDQVDYEGILDRREDAAGGSTRYTADILSPVSTPEATLADAAGAPRFMEAEPVSEVAQEKWLLARLDELDSAGGAAAYRQVLKGILTSLRSTGTLKEGEASFLVFRRLGRHLLLPGPEEILVMARAAVRELSSPANMERLVRLLALRSTEGREALSAVCDLTPEAAIPAMLTRLAEESEAFGRKTLITHLGRYGDQIRPFLESWLADDRWFVVRNALGLLAQVGGPADALRVTAFLANDNPKVRLEALRFLTRHPAPVNDRVMEALLSDRDAEVRSRAVYALGVLQGGRGRARLMSLAAKPFVGQGDAAMRELAIRGLGREGGSEAVSFLGSVLKQTALVDRAAHERIQKAAVDALTEIGGAGAAGLLRRWLGRLKGDARRAAEEFLRRAGTA